MTLSPSRCLKKGRSHFDRDVYCIIELLMNLPFFKKKAKKTPKFLTLEISSESVRCLAFYKEDGSLKIIGSGTSPLEAGAVRNGIIIDPGLVVQATQEAMNSATQNAEDAIKNVIIGVSSDLCLENVTTAKITRGSGTPITEKEVESFNEKIATSSEMQAQNYYSSLKGDEDTELQMITSSLVYIKLDNELVDNLEGKNGQVVEMALYTAFCPTYHVAAIQKLSKKLKLNVLAISPINFAVMKTLKQSDMESNDAILAQVGSDFTNIGVVFGGAVIKNKSLHIGFKHFVDEISRIMGLTHSEASKVVYSHSVGSLSASESVVIQNCLEEVLNIWLEGIKLLFGDFAGVKTFAPHMYLFGEGVQLPEIEDVLDKEPWPKSIPFKSPPTIKALIVGDLAKVADATGAVVSHEWVPAAALAYIYEEVI